jgi:hypothetical protein
VRHGGILIIPALGKLKQEDHEFKASLGHIHSKILVSKKKKLYYIKKKINQNKTLA